jgi:hypothetical protein
MIAEFAHVNQSLNPIAASDGGIGQLVVLAVVMIVSIIGSLLKKKAEQNQSGGPKAPPAPPVPPARWPPIGTTSGPTVPPTRRPPTGTPPGPAIPPARQAPPVVRAPQSDDRRDQRHNRLDQMEGERTDRIEPEMQERSRRLKKEAEVKAEQGKASAQRVRQAAERSTAARADLAAKALPPALPRRAISDPRFPKTRPLPDSLKALLAEPNWRAAILLSEIFGPPVGLREISGPGGTTPPALSRPGR